MYPFNIHSIDLTKDIDEQEKKLDCDQEDKSEKVNSDYLYRVASLHASLPVETNEVNTAVDNGECYNFACFTPYYFFDFALLSLIHFQAVNYSATNNPGLLTQENISTARNLHGGLNKRCDEGSVAEPNEDSEQVSGENLPFFDLMWFFILCHMFPLYEFS